MFGLSFTPKSNRTFTCSLTDHGYSLTVIQNDELLFCERHDFPNKPFDVIANSFASETERLGLIGEICQVILAPGQYELLLLDALEIPESEMAKAFRWKLKGLVDLPLNDIAVDTFTVPPHGGVGQRKKVFVAVTLLSALKNKLNMFESAYIYVNKVTIAELALRNLVACLPSKNNCPTIVISLEEGICQLHIFYLNQLYLVRQLALTQTIVDENGERTQNILLEIQRSVDYCLSELKLPEPDQIVFTPSFYKATVLFEFLKQELPNKEILLMDLNSFLEPGANIALEDQQKYLYSIGGALVVPNATEEIENP